jgi:hypothetical protein
MIIVFASSYGDKLKQIGSYAHMAALYLLIIIALNINTYNYREVLIHLGLFPPLIFIIEYNGKKSEGIRPVFSKWLFYVFYPLHMTALTAIKAITAG